MKLVKMIGVTGMIVGSILSSCQSSHNKVESKEDKLLKEKEDVVEAKQDLNQAVRDSIRQFKLDAITKINENNRKIADYKQKVANGKQSDKNSRKIADLEQRNKELQKRLDEFNDESSEKWSAFRREFSHDMDEMDNSVKDLTKDNVD